MSTSNFLNIKYQGINIPSQTTSVAATAGDIGYNSTSNKWAVWNTVADNLVTENTTQTLFNKTLDPSTTISTITTLTNANLSGSAGITNANLAAMPADTIKGNNTGSSATPSDLTVAQVNAILPVFTTTLNGLAPFSGGGAVNFLRADGTWAAPAGATSGTVTSVSVISANGLAGTVATSTTTPAITLSTTVTGILQGNGIAISAATTTGTGSVVLAGTPTITNLNAGSTQITNVTDPTTAQMAATKNYVDMVASGLQPLQAVYAATTGTNILGTYINGAGGIGATFTTTATTTLTVDGTTPPLNSRILIKDQTSALQNGVYNLTAAAVPGVSGTVFTRSLDYDTASDMNAGNLIPILNGTVNAPSGNPTIWIQTDTVTTVGTDPLLFVKFNSGGSGSVTSVALTAPALFTVSGSPITTSGTLTVAYSGSALPIANGGTNATSAAAAYNNLSPMTTAGDMEYEVSAGTAGRLPIGIAGYVLTSGGSAPQWSPVSTQGSVVASYYASVGQTVGSGVQINFDTKLVDTNNSVITGTGAWKFTAPVAGNYLVSIVTVLSAVSNGNDLQLYLNGTTYKTISCQTGNTDGGNQIPVGTCIVPLSTGQFIDIRPSGSMSFNGNTAPYDCFVEIALLTGGVAPSQISSVVATYFVSNPSNISVPALNQINFDTSIVDTNNAVTTGSNWKFTAPTTGNYYIFGSVASSGTSAGNLIIYKNGSAYMVWSQALTSNNPAEGAVGIPLNQGDFIDLRPTVSTSITGDPIGASQCSYISIMLATGAPQPIIASYGLTTGASVSSGVQINFDTRLIDTNSAVTTGAGTWKFTAPIKGYYTVSSNMYLATGSSVEFDIYVNGTVYAGMGTVSTSASQQLSSIIVSLNTNDFIDIRPFGAGVTTQGFSAGRYNCTISISQVH